MSAVALGFGKTSSLVENEPPNSSFGVNRTASLDASPVHFTAAAFANTDGAAFAAADGVTDDAAAPLEVSSGVASRRPGAADFVVACGAAAFACGAGAAVGAADGV